MDNWFRSKWFVRAISLAFAILLFVFVNVEIDDTQSESRFSSTTKDLQMVENVPVDIRIDKNFVVSGVPKNVSVSLEGAKSILAPVVKQRNFEVYVDLRGLGDGEHKVEMEYANISDDLKVYIEPKTVDVTIEERSSKEFDVNVDLINEDQLPDGYEIGATEVNPKTVTITSSKSVVDQIAMVKVFLDVKGIDKSIKNREIPVNVYDSQGNKLNVGLDPENVEVSAELNNPSKAVPISVETSGELPDGHSLTSATPETDEVTVYGRSSVLQDLEQVATKEIDLSKMKKSQTVDVDLALPDGVQASDGDTIKVDVEIDKEDIDEPVAKADQKKPDEPDEQEQTKTIKDVPIDVKNLGDDQKVSFVEPGGATMGLTAAGNKDDIDKLTADDMTLSVDLADLDVGEHNVPISIKGPDGNNYTGELDEVTIEITGDVTG